jgi:hypothetical protein
MAIQPMTCLQSPVPPLKPVKKAEQLIAEGIARQKIIDRLLAGANRYGARQRIIDRLLRNAHRAVEGRAHDEDTQK